MIDFSLHWTVGYSLIGNGGNMDNPSWEVVAAKLEEVRSRGGDVTIFLSNAPSPGPKNLQVRSGGGDYIVMLGEENERGYKVRTFYVPKNVGEVEIAGDDWDARMCIQDFEKVVGVFREFLETGNVSGELLS